MIDAVNGAPLPSRGSGENIVFISCEVLRGIIKPGENGAKQSKTKFLDIGLHAIPKVLKDVLQDEIDAITEPSWIVLGFGLCGNGLHEIQAGIHTLIVPKVDDCIAMFMGSKEIFTADFFDNPGTYYLTRGWLESDTHPLAYYQAYLDSYGEEMAQYMMDIQFKNYRRLVYVAHCAEEIDQFGPLLEKIADYCAQWEMVYEVYLGKEDFLKEIEELTSAPVPISDSFLVIHPGEILTQEMFF